MPPARVPTFVRVPSARVPVASKIWAFNGKEKSTSWTNLCRKLSVDKNFPLQYHERYCINGKVVVSITEEDVQLSVL